MGGLRQAPALRTTGGAPRLPTHDMIAPRVTPPAGPSATTALGDVYPETGTTWNLMCI